jgi:ribosomal protein S18 acetylase RimI-like enzyme
MLRQQIALRKASSEDEQFLANLYRDVRREEVSAWGWPTAQEERFLQMQLDAQRRSYQASFPGAVDNIILMEDAPIGRMMVGEEASGLHLIDIALLSAYRNRGIGSLLLHDLLQECRTNRCVLRLHVRHESAAVRFYQRLGFHQTGTDLVYARMEWSPQSRAERFHMSQFEDFAPHLHSVFQTVRPEGHALKLVEMSDYSNDRQKQFSLVFASSDSPWLTQGTYTLQHPDFSEIALFLVPLGPGREGMQYEAVFSRLLNE